MNKMKVIVEESLAKKLMCLEHPQLLAGFTYDAEIRVTDALPIETGRNIREIEGRLISRHLYPIEPDDGKEILGTYKICNVSVNYGVVVLKQDSGLVAFNYSEQERMRPLELCIESF